MANQPLKIVPHCALARIGKAAVFLGFFNGVEWSALASDVLAVFGIASLSGAGRPPAAPGAILPETAEQRTIKRRLQHGYK
jgi:hypothetical protein